MKSLAYVLPCVALTFFSWGVYGPVLHVGQELMADSQGLSTLRPFICVGVAYFLIAVVFPLVVLCTKGGTCMVCFLGDVMPELKQSSLEKCLFFYENRVFRGSLG